MTDDQSIAAAGDDSWRAAIDHRCTATTVDSESRCTVRESIGGPSGVPAAIRYAVASAALAPSIHNTQPWLFHVPPTSAHVELRADHSRGLSCTDPDGRQLTISCGAALLNLQLGLAAAGLCHETDLQAGARQRDLLAVVEIVSDPARCRAGGAELRVDAHLARQIPFRRTAREPFIATPASESALGSIIDAAQRPGIRWTLVTSATQRAEVARLTRAAHRIQDRNPDHQREVLTWTRATDDKRMDGVRLADLTHASFANLEAELPQRDFALGRDIVTRLHPAAAARTAVLAVLSTDADGPADWLRAGMSLERLLLRGCAEGLAMSYINQSVEMPAMRTRLQAALQLPTIPQLVIRIGIPSLPTPRASSARRPLADILRVVDT